MLNSLIDAKMTDLAKKQKYVVKSIIVFLIKIMLNN